MAVMPNVKPNDKVLIIGSGPTAREYENYPFRENGWSVVCVNHAWEIEPKCDMWVTASDYESAGGSMPDNADQMPRNSDYGITLNHFGGHAECGFSITLASAYNALWMFKPKVVGFLGCDMNYTPDENGHTHIYGVGLDIKKDGVPDPDKMVKHQGFGKPDYLKNIYTRFMDVAKERKCCVFNLSSDKDTRLPYPQTTPEIAEEYHD
jgi:hypothetical protein